MHKISMVVLALCLLGCCPDRKSCEDQVLVSPNGEARRISPAYIERYGCATFADMATTDPFLDWCVGEGLGETVSGDVRLGCRPGETPGGCELYWVCE